jgi:hypothetical protein
MNVFFHKIFIKIPTFACFVFLFSLRICLLLSTRSLSGGEIGTFLLLTPYYEMGATLQYKAEKEAV